MIVPLAATSMMAGLLFGLSLIVAIGAQNAFVLRQGLRREHVLLVVGICVVSDAVLMATGVAGAGALLNSRRWLLAAVRVVGAGALFVYAGMAARRALRLSPAPATPVAAATSWSVVAGSCLAFTWLNPAVYLDTLILLGSVANSHHGHQWWFAGGAAVGSLLWFVGLGYGSRLLAPLFKRPAAWRALDGFVCLVMVGTGVRLLLAGG